MGHLCTNANNRGCIIHYAGLMEWEADGVFEYNVTMDDSLPHCIHEDGHEGVNPPKLVIGYLHQDQEEKRLLDQEEIVVCGLSLNWGEVFARLP